jgi:predicted enzyme related to lactoylglutathione lyase
MTVITGLVGITLWTDNLEGMFQFYHRTLGLPLHSRHDDFIAFQLGEVRFNLGRHDRVRGPARDPYRIMPHLGVDDIHQEHRRLSQAGVEFIRPPEQEHWGGWVATFKDPDGNILQLLQFPSP